MLRRVKESSKRNSAIKGDTNEERQKKKKKKKDDTQREILPVGEIHRENGVERKDEKHNNKEDEGGGRATASFSLYHFMVQWRSYARFLRKGVAGEGNGWFSSSWVKVSTASKQPTVVENSWG